MGMIVLLRKKINGYLTAQIYYVWILKQDTPPHQPYPPPYIVIVIVASSIVDQVLFQGRYRHLMPK